ncbi:hypothetical protein ACLSU7_05960 [Bdellovibrio sp. HCB185ZH]|uniref:hypothetical protein n=1 Tax=Bdellovibrio sp. HCB185ZH TaxID=3394235 RepID=UPI0039A56BA6
MSSRRQRHSPSTYHAGTSSRSGYSTDRGNYQGQQDFSYETRGHRPSENYFDEREQRGTGHGEYREPADYYSGRGAYGQDRFENASRNSRGDYVRGGSEGMNSRGTRSERYGRQDGYGQGQSQYGMGEQYGQQRGQSGERSRYGQQSQYGQQNQYGQQGQRNQYESSGRGGGRDRDQRYFDEDYEGTRGFNRNYNMNSDYESYGRQNESRRPYDEEHRAYERDETPQRMGQSWEGMDFENSDYGSSDYSRGNWQDEGYRRGDSHGRGGRHSRDMY